MGKAKTCYFIHHDDQLVIYSKETLPKELNFIHLIKKPKSQIIKTLNQYADLINDMKNDYKAITVHEQIDNNVKKIIQKVKRIYMAKEFLQNVITVHIEHFKNNKEIIRYTFNFIKKYPYIENIHDLTGYSLFKPKPIYTNIWEFIKAYNIKRIKELHSNILLCDNRFKISIKDNITHVYFDLNKHEFIEQKGILINHIKGKI